CAAVAICGELLDQPGAPDLSRAVRFSPLARAKLDDDAVEVTTNVVPGGVIRRLVESSRGNDGDRWEQRHCDPTRQAHASSSLRLSNNTQYSFGRQFWKGLER